MACILVGRTILMLVKVQVNMYTGMLRLSCVINYLIYLGNSLFRTSNMFDH